MATTGAAGARVARGRFAEDVQRYRAKGYGGHRLWLEPALWAIGTHRLGNWLYTEPPNVLLRVPSKALWFVLNKLCQIVMEMDIDAQATIGGGLYIGHIGGVHINPGAVLGRNCDLAHRITIGASAMGRSGIPVLGDEVYIGTGAALVGRIRIGNGAKIAANSLVITNVPAGATVMGVPARIIMQPPKPAVAKPEAVSPVVEDAVPAESAASSGVGSEIAPSAIGVAVPVETVETGGVRA